MEFKPFPSLSRLTRNVIITEKIDGTNAQVVISSWPEEFGGPKIGENGVVAMSASLGLVMRAGSRTRWITPADGNGDTDNAGFAAWCRDNAKDLFSLGEGQHFGEWWGRGIGRKYDQTERHFSLFNASRWTDERRPACCRVVPILYSGVFGDVGVLSAMAQLTAGGSVAAPGFMKPEGIVIFHTSSGMLFKKTLEKDEMSKTQAAFEAAKEAAAVRTS